MRPDVYMTGMAGSSCPEVEELGQFSSRSGTVLNSKRPKLVTISLLSPLSALSSRLY